MTKEKPVRVRASLHRTNIYLTTPQVEALSSLSEGKGLSVAELVRRAVDKYLDDVSQGQKGLRRHQN